MKEVPNRAELNDENTHGEKIAGSVGSGKWEVESGEWGVDGPLCQCE